ncbi:hypothetical protein J6590_076970 [Homalodisca vitripennis]|nr:hypothetical protein J6590_076970 [Homalodisca vitripennis]
MPFYLFTPNVHLFRSTSYLPNRVTSPTILPSNVSLLRCVTSPTCTCPTCHLSKVSPALPCCLSNVSSTPLCNLSNVSPALQLYLQNF